MARGNCDFRNVTSHEIPPLARSAIIADGTPAERGWKGRVGAAEQARGRPTIGDAALRLVAVLFVVQYPGIRDGYGTWV